MKIRIQNLFLQLAVLFTLAVCLMSFQTPEDQVWSVFFTNFEWTTGVVFVGLTTIMTQFGIFKNWPARLISVVAAVIVGVIAVVVAGVPVLSVAGWIGLFAKAYDAITGALKLKAALSGDTVDNNPVVTPWDTSQKKDKLG